MCVYIIYSKLLMGAEYKCVTGILLCICRLIYVEVVVGQLSLVAIIQSRALEHNSLERSPIHEAKSFDI